jgi:hypothetical protein
MAIFELAYYLKMPVYQLVQMPYEELLGWFDYFDRRPVGWRDDDRASKIMQSNGVKESPLKLFPSLEKIYTPKVEHDDKGLMRSMFLQKILGAVGGDKIQVDGQNSD